MVMDDLLVHMFCLIDDELKALDLPALRQRGPQPTLSDSEVITIQLIGEFLGLDQDRAIFRHFRDHHADGFTGLTHITRTTFVRQAANLNTHTALYSIIAIKRYVCSQWWCGSGMSL